MGNPKVVSAIGIEEGINYLQSQFIAQLDENVNEVIEQYKSLQAGALSSQNIDVLVAGINSQVTKLQSDFDDLASKIKTSMSQSTEAVTQGQANIESTLG